jgi:protein TonB
VPAPTRDLSRSPRPQSTQWDDCGFPPEADVEQIDFKRVTLLVTVGTDGRARSVTVVNDPGYGFGRLARQCAMRKRYVPGLDSAGRPVTMTTAPFIVRFTR